MIKRRHKFRASVYTYAMVIFFFSVPLSAFAQTEADLPLTASLKQENLEGSAQEDSLEQASEAVFENMQTALSLKRLLLGRDFLFFGRVEGEAAVYTDDVFDGENGAQIRRLRVGLAGVLSDQLTYKGEVDLTDKTATLSDIYLKWDSPRIGSLTVGNQRVTQNLSAMTGSLSQLFMEFPLPVTTFSLARRLGVSHDYYAKRWGGHAMFFTRDPNNEAGDRGWAARAILNPARAGGGVAHVGFSIVREKMDREARYRTRPESNVTDVRLVDTGTFYDVDYQNIFGLEIAGATGSFSGRIEALKSTWERFGDVKNEFYGAYLELGYFLTGEQFNYQKGRFLRPNIADGSPAWEVGARVSWVDLNDDDIRGGEQVNVGAALNFYPSRRLRFQTNVIYATTDEIAGDVRSLIIQARIQFNW